MFAKGLPNQRGTVDPRPFGRSVGGPKQLRIQHYLDGFHIVEDSPQSNPQSKRQQRTISLDKLDLDATIAANRERRIDLQITTDRIFLALLKFCCRLTPALANCTNRGGRQATSSNKTKRA